MVDSSASNNGCWGPRGPEGAAVLVEPARRGVGGLRRLRRPGDQDVHVENESRFAAGQLHTDPVHCRCRPPAILHFPITYLSRDR